ncbi:o-succinylbenzoate--CoA ligase [Corynebacterium sp. P7202]|uniref:O-succinylbenzoate--CoA ligase n=1 Tax=Corynebacterium pygosceleis TaxID=2800406 RepID=A0A9Q4GIA5_9CORY|nr:o-succinylbenzoate--CoA ligase [Corynebacterium pygosceleis]MCK7637458.1 o-succinylbenzoate--CoA ligase [Corynebacterium pygosceleis]MCX7445013.1 o-succinylbenzoate--CoA ligase [Corynebacterium pygosceleis]MCX7468213.1 o-succinylbenzoate--CoA ligase [Corynebacterium pygosceleis]
MDTRTLRPLPVPPGDPASILPDLADAIAGNVTWLPVPAGRGRADRDRAELLIRSQRCGAPVDPDIAVVVATSGSTGTPKGALLTPGNLVSAADATHTALGGEGHWLLAMPGHHIAGLQVLVRALVAGTAPLHLDVSDGFHVDAFAATTSELVAAAARDDTPAYTALVPLQLAKALDTLAGIEALRKFDAVLIGGGHLPRHLRQSCDRLGIRIVSTYGSSETTGGCVYDGHPVPGARVRIRDGRILLGGPMIAAGYRNPPPGDDSFAEPGWFATRDRGEITDGLLTVTGRLDDIIDSGGLKLHPGVVEKAMLDITGVDGACVVGVPHPRLGQAVVAAYTGSIDPCQVIEGLDELPRWQLPKDVRRLSTMPVTGPGKPDRDAVRRLFTTPRR